MDKLDSVVNRITAREPQPEQRRSFDSQSPVMKRLWLRMTEMYGTLWSNSQGGEPNETWTIGLSTINPQQISAGLAAVRDCAKPFPPTLPEFIGMCRGKMEGVRAVDKQAWRPASEVLGIESKRHFSEENKRIGAETLSTLKGLF